MDKHVLKAEDRKVTGRKVKKLRTEGFLPANVYGKDTKSQALKLDLKEFREVFAKAGETGIVELQVGKSKYPVLIHNIQNDPVTDEPIHADFLKVDLKEKVSATVPVELIGESPADKGGLGILVQQIDEIEVEALPMDLPEKIEVDISSLEAVDQAVYLKDLKYDRQKVKLEGGEEEERIVAKIEPLAEEEEVPAPTPPVEGEEGAVETKEGEEKGEKEPETETQDKDKTKESDDAGSKDQ